MKMGRRDDVPMDKREYTENYELGYRLDYLLGIILAFVGVIYIIYRIEIKGLVKSIINGNTGGVF